LTELVDYLEVHDLAGAQTLRVLANGNRQVADEKPEGSFVTDEREWSRELSALYGVLAVAETANRISTIVALELAVNPGTQTGEFYLTWRNGQTPNLPPFLPDGTEAGWQALERVAVVLRKYEEVDAVTDRLSYLAQALTTVEMAQTAVAKIGLPEGPLMQKIADNWRTVVANEINSISGRAELRLELRTRQLRRAEQVTVALRLQNVGRAAAEEVALTLSQDEAEQETVT
jgi:hypothetical protein